MDEILHKRIHGLKHSICLSLELYFPLVAIQSHRDPLAQDKNLIEIE
jgi:hypothetical protein